MSLVVAVEILDHRSGDLVPDQRVSLASNLAGFESWRSEVWGSPAVAKRGAVFLPRLREGNLFVPAKHFGEFRAECAALLQDVAGLSQELGFGDGGVVIAARLQNLVDAVDVADPERGVISVT